jgi:hypothetical protein
MSMDNWDCLAHYPFVVVRIARRVCSRRGSYRLARLAAKYGPEISLRDLTDRFSYDCMCGPRLMGERANLAVASTCPTSSCPGRRMRRSCGSSRKDELFDLRADGGIGSLKGRLRPRGAASADATNDREHGEETASHSPEVDGRFS